MALSVRNSCAVQQQLGSADCDSPRRYPECIKGAAQHLPCVLAGHCFGGDCTSTSSSSSSSWPRQQLTVLGMAAVLVAVANVLRRVLPPLGKLVLGQQSGLAGA